jgi:Cys-tRNA(Pro) deacylase
MNVGDGPLPERGTVTDRLIQLLRLHHVDFQLLEHEPVTTSEEAARVRGTPLEQGAKALVCRADDRHILIVLPANRRLDTKSFKRAHGVKNLRMISPDELRELTGLEVGAVPPIGNLLDLPTYVDERLLELPRISFNAGSRSVSIIMQPADYRRLVNPIVARFASEDT